MYGTWPRFSTSLLGLKRLSISSSDPRSSGLLCRFDLAAHGDDDGVGLLPGRRNQIAVVRDLAHLSNVTGRLFPVTCGNCPKLASCHKWPVANDPRLFSNVHRQ